MNDTEKSNIIFDLTDTSNKYKGILFAEIDNQEVDKEMGCLSPKDFCVGIMALIWEDRKGVWHFKMRLKFPSGNKQVATKNFDVEFEKGIKVNETFVLHEIYRMKMINKMWLSNPEGTSEGIIKLIEDADMVESRRILRNDD